MSGHGHVAPNADGSKARCGGPAMCSVCQREAAVLAGTLSADPARNHGPFTEFEIERAVSAFLNRPFKLVGRTSFTMVERDAVNAVRRMLASLASVPARNPERADGPYPNCHDCGGPMQWDSPKKRTWMCPSCVWERMVAAEKQIARTAPAGCRSPDGGKNG